MMIQQIGKFSFIKKFFGKAVSLIALLLLGGLAYLSSRFTMVLQYPTVFGENTLPLERSRISIIIFAIIIVIAIIIFYFIESNSSKNIKILFFGAFIILLLEHTLLGIFIITNNFGVGGVDPGTCWKTAKEIFDKIACSSPDYFYLYPPQVNIVFWMNLMMNIAHTTSILIWKILLLISLLGLDIGIVLLTNELKENNKYMSMFIVTLLMMFFIPLVFYTSYIYGTLTSLCLTVWSFFLYIKFIKTYNKGYVVIMILLLTISIHFYTGTIVAALAIFVSYIAYLIMGTIDIKKLCIFLFIIVCTFTSVFISEKGISLWFQNATGIEVGKGIPASAYVYMGLTAVVGSEYIGSYNIAHKDIYLKYGEDANSIALNEDKKIVAEFISGERNSAFLVEKIKGEWLEPWFGGIGQTIRLDEGVSDSFIAFMNGKFIFFINHILPYFVSLVYFLATVEALIIFLKSGVYKHQLLIYIYFIGGFVFYLFWESKARYCLPYFVLLFPVSAIAVVDLIKLIKQYHLR